MAIRWLKEEKTLTNIKKIIAAVWRMNSQQLGFYCRKLQKNQPSILPGQLGNAFLKKLEWISEQKTGVPAKTWSQLMQDAERLLYLIHTCSAFDVEAWQKVLQKLEEQQQTYFHTELGIAFILVLKEKLGAHMPEKGQKALAQKGFPTACANEKKELEKIAIWLTCDMDGQSVTPEKKKAVFFMERFRKAAIVTFACLSAWFMCVWLYGQAERNIDQWSLKQMKVSADGDTDAPLAEKLEPGIQADATKQKAAVDLKKPQKAKAEDKIKSNPKKLPQYRKMSKEYPQLYGWLQIPKTQIDFPVMRAKGDREFYLNHDFTGAESAEGALFVDEKSSIYPLDGNTVIYGHNMKNGHIFGTLKMYTDEDFFQEHRKICFDTIYEAGIYEAVAVLKTRILNENEQGFRYYQFFRYQNEEEFQECQDFVEENQIFETDSVLQYGDHILMLSTCEYSQENGRLVVVARKLSDKK